MKYRVNEVKLNLFDGYASLEEQLARRVRKLAGVSAKGVNINEFTIVKESVDARDKEHLLRVLTVDFACSKKLSLPEAPSGHYNQLMAQNKPDTRPVVVGFGPCGMFAALILAAGGLDPLVIERGKSMEDRIPDVERYWKEGILNEESNVQFGEGGAGTFSDGKLATGIRDLRIGKVMEEFVLAGADPAIKYLQKPHIGTDRLRQIVPAIRRKIIALGGEFLFERKVEELCLAEATGPGQTKEQPPKRVTGVVLSDGQTIATDTVVLAVGHSARDTFAMLRQADVPMEQKSFSIGLRIEHPQEMIDEAMYGSRFKQAVQEVGPASYNVAHHGADGRGVYSFCMCPGGEVVMSASEKETIVTNGMSHAARDGKYANSALLVDVRVEDYASLAPGDVLAGAVFQRKYEQTAFALGKGVAPRCELGAFPDSTVYGSLPTWAGEDIIKAMPAFAGRIKSFARPDAILTGVETRSSSPVRILRGADMTSLHVAGLYPGGEGAGYAGGITSAAVDGIKIAEAILEKYV